ncbi:hypothetical protein [Pseudobdellovibrio exovorus]|nr:hypothetical protein [Pseudobdellovibrio exovorus]
MNSRYGWLEKRSDSSKDIEPLGFLPLVDVVQNKFPLSGQAPVWILSETAISKLQIHVEYLGDLIFMQKSFGGIYVSCHYLDDERKYILTQKLGPPHRYDYQQMLSSGRTVLVRPHTKKTPPFCLKFCGQTVARLEQKADRHLKYPTIQSTVAANSVMRSKSILKENSALYFKLTPDHADLLVIYRQFPEVEVFAPQDLYLPLFAVLSKLSPSLRSSFLGNYSNEPFRWLQTELVPQMAHLLWLPFELSGHHLEIHQQNINLLMRDGSILEVFYQDSCDVLEDIFYQFFRLRLPPDVVGLKRKSSFPAVGEYSSQSEQSFNSNISFWYRYFLRDFGLYAQSINVNLLQETTQKVDFFLLLLEEIRPKLKSYLLHNSLQIEAQNLHEFTVTETCDDLFMFLAAARDLILKATALQMRRQLTCALENIDSFYSRCLDPNSIYLYTYGVDKKIINSMLNSRLYSSVILPQVLYKAQVLMLQKLDDPSEVHLVAHMDLEGPRF